MDTTVAVGAGVAALGAVLCLLLLPGRARTRPEAARIDSAPRHDPELVGSSLG